MSKEKLIAILKEQRKRIPVEAYKKGIDYAIRAIQEHTQQSEQKDKDVILSDYYCKPQNEGDWSRCKCNLGMFDKKVGFNCVLINNQNEIRAHYEKTAIENGKKEIPVSEFVAMLNKQIKDKDVEGLVAELERLRKVNGELVDALADITEASKAVKKHGSRNEIHVKYCIIKQAEQALANAK